MNIIESAVAPVHDYFDLYKKCYNHYYCSCHCSCYNYHNKKVRYIFLGNEHKGFCEKIIKLYFNVWYIKFFYLFSIYNNSNIDCNKKIKINHMIYIIILFLLNSFIVINIKMIFSLVIINRSSLLLTHVRSSVVVRSKELVLCTLITSVFCVLLSNK